MSQVKPRTIRMSDKDWSTTETLAKICNMTPSEYIRLLIESEAKSIGQAWEGVGKEGRPTKERKA